MPKINVYIPEWMAQALQQYNLPTSQICQQALTAEIAAKLPLTMLTRRSRNIIHEAAKEAEQRGHNYIGTEHILLSLTADKIGVGGRVLHELGVTELIREKIQAYLSSEGYNTSSNQVVDNQGNLIGYLNMDKEGRTVIIDAEGNQVRPRFRSGSSARLDKVEDDTD